MAPLTSVFAVLIGCAGLLLTVLNIREKLKPKGPHPLDDRLRDIALAIRERGPDFHLRLDKP